jgi:hypothetical protein
MFNLAKPNLGLANPSWVYLFLTEHTKMEFANPFFLFVFLNGHLKYSIERISMKTCQVLQNIETITIKTYQNYYYQI